MGSWSWFSDADRHQIVRVWQKLRTLGTMLLQISCFFLAWIHLEELFDWCLEAFHSKMISCVTPKKIRQSWHGQSYHTIQKRLHVPVEPPFEFWMVWYDGPDTGRERFQSCSINFPVIQVLGSKFFQRFGLLPSLKLTYPLKMDGWKTSWLLGRPIFRCELLVSGISGRVVWDGTWNG